MQKKIQLNTKSRIPLRFPATFTKFFKRLVCRTFPDDHLHIYADQTGIVPKISSNIFLHRLHRLRNFGKGKKFPF